MTVDLLTIDEVGLDSCLPHPDVWDIRGNQHILTFRGSKTWITLRCEGNGHYEASTLERP